MLIAFLIVSGIFGYGLVAGMTFKGFSHYGNFYDEFGPGIAAIFWPFALPAGIGAVLLGKKISTERISRDDRRRRKELAEANHRKELARIAAEELAINERSLQLDRN